MCEKFKIIEAAHGLLGWAGDFFMCQACTTNIKNQLPFYINAVAGDEN